MIEILNYTKEEMVFDGTNYLTQLSEMNNLFIYHKKPTILINALEKEYVEIDGLKLVKINPVKVIIINKTILINNIN